MIKTFAFILCLLYCGIASAQVSDFLALKKRNGITIMNWYPGSPIQFFTTTGVEVNGIVSKVEKDTLYLSFYDVRMMYGRWGNMAPDTITRYDMKYHYKEIAVIPKAPGGFEFVRNGQLFILGGSAYAILHLANSAIQHADPNWKTVGISAGVAALGLTMKWLRKYRYTIGNKYHIQYVKLNP